MAGETRMHCDRLRFLQAFASRGMRDAASGVAVVGASRVCVERVGSSAARTGEACSSAFAAGAGARVAVDAFVDDPSAVADQAKDCSPMRASMWASLASIESSRDTTNAMASGGADATGRAAGSGADCCTGTP